MSKVHGQSSSNPGFNTSSQRRNRVLRVQGTNAIFLAGRTDVTIPLLGSSSANFPLLRHSSVRSDFLQETFPKSIPVRPKKTFTFRASGTIDFFNGSFGGYNPDGNNPNGSALFGLEGISGYRGSEGALVGVFLTNKNPVTRVSPIALDFTSAGLGQSFTKLSPKLGQVFFIGDGRTGTGSGKAQKFISPKGATRLFVGLADGFAFDGQPGAYEDNDGFYKVSITQHR